MSDLFDPETLGLRPLPGRAFRLALARHADAIRYVALPGLVELPHGVDQAEADQAVARARRETHDGCIVMAGASRLTGIAWYQETGPAAAALLEAFCSADDDAASAALPKVIPPGGVEAHVDMLRAVLRDHPASILVVAICAVDSRVAAAALS
jgi:hypothetical protein